MFLVQNRNYWNACPFPYDKQLDLVLSFDFGVVNQVVTQGGMAAYLDHLVVSEVMERYNFETYDFFAKWYLDEDGQDLFAYKGIGVGNAFRIHIWNDITYNVRILLNLLAVSSLEYEKLFVGLYDISAIGMLKVLDLAAETWAVKIAGGLSEYYFPIHRWMDERVRPTGLKPRLKSTVKNVLGMMQVWADRLRMLKTNDVDMFIQSYHPTRGIVERLKQDGKVNVILENFTRIGELIKERRLPAGGSSRPYRQLSKEMVDRFRSEKVAQWDIEGIDIGGILHRVILERVSRYLPDYLSTLDAIIGYFKHRQLALMVPVTETWMTNCLMMNYCDANNIPIYMIINGFLGPAYGDEAKHATVINSYGESIKNNYFRGMDNIVCLGDPRMDHYVGVAERERKWTDTPTIVIGAAGFNNIDLNSYVAYEFDFINDVLAACKMLSEKGRKMNLVLKVRSNGYIDQYASFLQEYYPSISIQLYDRIPFGQLISQADFYISFYSQTLFEASCLGIPALYYKKDNEIMPPPFDGASELVTAFSFDDLVHKMDLFYQRDPIYQPFQDKRVMEKYLGPLDGHNLERNVDFIYSLISSSDSTGRR